MLKLKLILAAIGLKSLTLVIEVNDQIGNLRFEFAYTSYITQLFCFIFQRSNIFPSYKN